METRSLYPILIVGEDGAPLGSFYPARVCATQLAEDIDEMLDRPDWREAYGTWLRAARMRVLGEWRKARETEGAPPAPGEFGELVRRHVYCAEPNSLFADATGLWRGALCALAAGAIRSAGLQPVVWGAGGEALDLLADLTRILELRLRLDVREGIECGLEGEAVVLRVFQALSPTLETEAQRTIGSLARRVKQVLAEWR